MRINKYLAQASGISRRQADFAVSQGNVRINNKLAHIGDDVKPNDQVFLEGKKLSLPGSITILLNKPKGYVCSRRGQGSLTIYDLLPKKYESLKSIGRLDKDSSGLIVLTNDGDLAYQLSHPKFVKTKVYEIALKEPLLLKDLDIIEQGIKLDDGPSHLKLLPLGQSNESWKVVMHEGRNRQIRRTFEALGNQVLSLKRLEFGEYKLDDLAEGKHTVT
jgi:23S rRNA pseudouridine2605 synthase